MKLDTIKFVTVDNKTPHWKANSKYIPVIFQTDDETFTALFTVNDIKRAVKRANKNPEDCPKQSFWSKLFKV